MSQQTRLLVIGCGGFIGSHLLDRLFQSEQYQVRGWDPAQNKIERHLANPGFDFNQAALSGRLDEPNLARDIEWAHCVVNLAAVCQPAEYNTNPIAVIRSNFLEPYRLVEICAERKTWLLHFSTSEVYGRTLASYLPGAYGSGERYSDPSLYELREEHTPLVMGPIRNQRWTYACAKQLMERYIYAHHAEMGLPFTIVRPLNFFGPRMDYIPGRDGEGVPRVLACFMTALLENTAMRIVDGGVARRTIVSIHDAIRAIVAMIEKPDRSQNRIFNIGNRRNEISVIELAALMRQIYAEITGRGEFLDHPIEQVSGFDFYGEGYEDCDRRMPNLELAEELLGWTPRLSLRETLEETMRYYHQAYAPLRC